MPEIIMAFASLTFLIIYALKTRRMAESMALATLLAIIAQFLLYVPQKITTVKQFFEHFFNGAKGMTSLAIVVCFGFMLSEANRELGLFDILVNGIGGTVPAALVPPLAVLVGATVFAVGGCCAAQVCFDRIQAGAGIREGVHSRSSRVLNSTGRRFSGILPLIYNEGGVIPIWILTAVTIRVTS